MSEELAELLIRITKIEAGVKVLDDGRWASVSAVAALIICLASKSLVSEEDFDKILEIAEKIAADATEIRGAVSLDELMRGLPKRRRKRTRRR